MAGNPSRKDEKLLALKKAYVAQLPDRLEQILASWKTVQHASENCEQYDELYRGVHSLAGSAGTFSFMRLSQLARETELQLKQWNTQQQDAPLIQKIEKLLRQLQESVNEASVEKPEPPPPERDIPARVTISERQICVLEEDVALAREIAERLQHFGYEAVTFRDCEDAAESMQQQLPAAMVLDTQFQTDVVANSRLEKQKQLLLQHRIPLIYISSHNNWESRLDAVRAGGQAYLTKPVDFTALIEHLDQLTARHPQDPHRILIVEDTELLAQHYAGVLQGAGMETMVLTEPSKLLEKLTEFKPELVLMDLYMPECSGVEAAQVIRQLSNYDSLPIVYLSTENALDRQLKAMGRGGDDFLQKPITDSHLVAAVSIRAQRFRALNSLMSRDSLTGLLNHINVKLNLETELARTARNQQPLSFVMLDIDHFKSVNDNYGHPVGDQIIKSLARLLTDRLRKTDVVGRYGGEEFALILPDTEPHMALGVVNQLRHDFSQLLHSHHDSEFNATFSAGIAGSPPHNDVDTIIRAADDALYTAKHRGRNRVELGKP
ncbi:diguanylate cyclase [Kaarinaea lacus]